MDSLSDLSLRSITRGWESSSSSSKSPTLVRPDEAAEAAGGALPAAVSAMTGLPGSIVSSQASSRASSPSPQVSSAAPAEGGEEVSLTPSLEDAALSLYFAEFDLLAAVVALDEISFLLSCGVVASGLESPPSEEALDSLLVSLVLRRLD